MSGDDDVVLQGAVGDLGLDKHRPPPIDKMPSMQEWGWRISTGEVVSDEQQWAARAAAAARAAELLKACMRTANQIVNSNYVGNGCAEGKALFDDLKKALNDDGGWRHSLDTQVSALLSTAQNCRSAGATHSQVDVENSAKLRT